MKYLGYFSLFIFSLNVLNHFIDIRNNKNVVEVNQAGLKPTQKWNSTTRYDKINGSRMDYAGVSAAEYDAKFTTDPKLIVRCKNKKSVELVLSGIFVGARAKGKAAFKFDVNNVNYVDFNASSDGEAVFFTGVKALITKMKKHAWLILRLEDDYQKYDFEFSLENAAESIAICA